MSIFTLAISCLATSNLPWFMDLTFQVPMQYCSLQHQTSLPSPVISTTGWCFCFDAVSSFFLELFLHYSPVAYWAPTDLGSSYFSILSFCLFILFMGFSKQEYWSGLPFPSPVDHILSELSAMTRLISHTSISSLQFSSVTQSCPTLCDPMNRSTPGLPVHHQLPEFTQTHVHRVHDAIQPSCPLSSPSPPAPNPSQHQSLFQWVNSSREVAKVLEF